MLCKIAELITEVPMAGGMALRCRDYLYDGDATADIVIREDAYDPEKHPGIFSADQLAYMESGRQFHSRLLEHNGLYLHASAVVKDGKAFLFSGRSGAGKSTHTSLWQQELGEDVVVINDDKPALRCLDGVWYAYGTPWCGKDGINRNMKAPLAGICFLKQAKHNQIRRLSAQEALQRLLGQTIWKVYEVKYLDLLMARMDELITNIPVFELENRPEAAAAQLSYTTMRRTAEEMGL
ncbi:MAG: hypothetical protein IJ375_00925 [Oscillospiraceae bacterium]|nr:hypothetical protein [Oscillospiraceae bacterium]